MPTLHVAIAGDCFGRIARRYGFGKHSDVYDHSSNAALKERRPNPDQLFPGDKVSVPDVQPKVMTLATGAAHKIIIATPRKELNLRITTIEGEPVRSTPYVLQLAGPSQKRFEGTTDGDGRLTHPVPIATHEAVLDVADQSLLLKLGYQAPLPSSPEDPPFGVEARLNALGYLVGDSAQVASPSDEEGPLAPMTKAALALFQQDEDLEVTGTIDGATLTKLKERYGC